MTLRFLPKIQQRIYDLLSDGKPHRRKEVHTCLSDCLSSMGAIRQQICLLRKNLPSDLAILCVIDGKRGTNYQLVRIYSKEPAI